jgi:transposase
MSREIRADYDQVWMFPPSVEDWIGADHPARFIRDFVDALDLLEMAFKVEDSGPGRPRFASDLLLKVWVYGYINRIRSPRKLEQACRENMGLIWLTGLNSPDHSSIWRFWRDNKKRLREIFKKTVLVAVRSGLIGPAAHAVDGTKIAARAARCGVKNREELRKMLEFLDQSLDAAMKEVEEAQARENGEYRLSEAMADMVKRRETIREALGELEAGKRKVIHPGEPDVRYIKTRRRSMELVYNGQVVADQTSGMIVAQDVVTDEADNGLLVPMLDMVKENVGAVAEENVTDGGYYSSSQIGLAEERGYEVLTGPPPSEVALERSEKVDPYHPSRFVYDEEQNRCICPHGSVLTYLYN